MEKELRDKQFTILHIASHGQFESDVRKTFLLTFKDRLSMDQLDQFVGFYRFREEPLELLTLSACETAVGDDRAALGLAGVAVKAGARSALATLWYINDKASSLLVSEFYRQLHDPSISRATALQRAQLKLLNDRSYHHPGYWSPFLLINNWL
jgi:CHAT domain-containing protein